MTQLFAEIMTMALLVTLPDPVLSQIMPPPPPPQSELEIFGPTHRTHRIDATCSSSKLSIEWKFSGKEARLSYLSFRDKTADSIEMRKINQWIAKIPGDVFAWVECENSGAIISFVQANAAGTSKAKQIKLNWINGKAKLIRHYGF